MRIPLQQRRRALVDDAERAQTPNYCPFAPERKPGELTRAGRPVGWRSLNARLVPRGPELEHTGLLILVGSSCDCKKDVVAEASLLSRGRSTRSLASAGNFRRPPRARHDGRQRKRASSERRERPDGSLSALRLTLCLSGRMPSRIECWDTTASASSATGRRPGASSRSA